MDNSQKLCPCCQQSWIEGGENTFDICDVCGWEDDGIQADDPDFEGGANGISLNQYRKEWKAKSKASSV